MKVYAPFADLPPSTIQSNNIDKDKEKKQITYPYQDELKKYAEKELAWYVVMFTCFIESVYYFYNSSDFFYPCQYPNLISINDTLQLKSLYKSSIQNGTYMNHLELNEKFEYHAIHWKECFKKNVINFEAKVLAFQMISFSIGAALAIQSFYNFYKRATNIRSLDLTDDEINAYQKDWKGFTFNLIMKTICLITIYLYLLIPVFHWCYGIPNSVLRMPFFK